MCVAFSLHVCVHKQQRRQYSEAATGGAVQNQTVWSVDQFSFQTEQTVEIGRPVYLHNANIAAICLFFLPVYLSFTAYRESSRTSSGRGAVEGVMVISDKSQTFLDVKLLL